MPPPGARDRLRLGAKARDAARSAPRGRPKAWAKAGSSAKRARPRGFTPWAPGRSPPDQSPSARGNPGHGQGGPPGSASSPALHTPIPRPPPPTGSSRSGTNRARPRTAAGRPGSPGSGSGRGAPVPRADRSGARAILPPASGADSPRANILLRLQRPRIASVASPHEPPFPREAPSPQATEPTPLSRHDRDSEPHQKVRPHHRGR